MYNIGIVSTSYIGNEFIEAVKFNDHANIKAVYSRKENTGKVFKNNNNIDILYTDYTKMLQNNDIQIIYISSPNSLHFSQAFEALKHKKHVIVEKPITLYKTELEILYKEATKNNVLIMEAIVNIHYNTFNKVKEWIKQIGDIHYINFNLQKQTRHFEKYKKGEQINVFSQEMGGGALRDLGPYPIYPLLYFFGVPQKIKYSNIKNKDHIDESTVILCSYEKATAVVAVSKLITDNRTNIISGTNGYIEIDNINHFNKISLYDTSGNLINEVLKNYDVRMQGQVDYFINNLLKNNLIDEQFKNISLNVCEIIEKNYN